MTWDEILEVLKALPEEARAKRAKMLVHDEYWFLDLMQSAKSGEVYVAPVFEPDDGEETDSS